MNKREFLKFLPVIPAAAVVPAAVANTKPIPKQFSCYNEPISRPQIYDNAYGYANYAISPSTTTPTLMISGGCSSQRTAALKFQINNNTFETACFEQRSDGNYSLVFKKV